MTKYVGIKDGNIVMVSGKPFVPPKGITIVATELDDPMAESLRTVRTPKPISELRVAFVGNWRMVCGISTFSEKLWPLVAPKTKEFKLFIERNDSPTGLLDRMGDTDLPLGSVVPCWKRGEPLKELIAEIEKFDPDVVWIQHEWGIWPNARHWLSFMTAMRKRRVIVTMHSIFDHRDKTVCEAAIPEMVVHLEGAKRVLKEIKKVSGRVEVIPHGCDPCTDPSRLWNLYRSSRTFVQAGFGFPYKGWETSLRATSLLLKRFPDVFFTGVFSESPFNAANHELYHRELMKLVESLGIRDSVSIVRGFQSDAVLDSFLRTNQAAVFPYVSTPKHEVFGASGAARLAMSKGTPVVTSRVNHFSDLPSLKIDTPEELADVLASLFEDPKRRKKQVQIQNEFLSSNSWEVVAARYISLFEE